MVSKLKFNDIVQVISQYNVKPGWVGYVRGEVIPSIARGIDYILIRFAHQPTGLHTFLRCDLSNAETAPGILWWKMPHNQARGQQERIVYSSEDYILHGLKDEIQLPPPIEPEPEPEPTPEPELLPITIIITTMPGLPLVVGDWGKANVAVKLTNPYVYSQQVLTGSKPEYGIGGFEFLVYCQGVHWLFVDGYQFALPLASGTTRVTFNRGQQEQEEMGRLTLWVNAARAQLIMAKYPNLFSIQ